MNDQNRKQYLLAVDGGGTKTEFCISDLEGHVMGSVCTGSSNYKSVGTEITYQSFLTGVSQVKERLGVGVDELAFSVWGISGCDSEHDFKLVEGLIDRLGIAKERRFLCNDGLLAFYAQADEPGIVIISGTGSIIMGVDAKGNMARSGGWGYHISDIGSGYWIGNEALKQTLLYCDGCCEYSLLYEQVRRHFRAKSFDELPYKIIEITDYYEIAKFARMVVELSSDGEKNSGGILERGAGVLAKLVKSTYDKLHFHQDMEFQIVFSGGVLKSEEYQKILKMALQKEISLEHVKFTTQKYAPVSGGIKLAVNRTVRDGREDDNE